MPDRFLARLAIPVLAAAATFAALPSPVVAQTATARTEDTATADHDGLVTPAAGDPGHERLAPTITAVQLEGEIELDGRLDEPVWRTAPAADRFLQREPHEGRPATQRTEIRFVYDDRHLYVGARMFDDQGPTGITSRLVRRDATAESDWLTLTFDTFLDHRGRTVFAVTPAGPTPTPRGTRSGERRPGSIR